MAELGDFVARWSRLKRRARAEPREVGARSGASRPTLDEALPQAAPPEVPAPAAIVQPQIVKQAEGLPSVETLGRDSDYTPFMRPDVPDGLRNAALRKLWQSDPVFANLDGLVDYAEDYGAGFALSGTVATVYRVLEGMPDPLEEEPPQSAEGAQPTGLGPAGEPAADAPGAARPTADSRSRDGKRECELDEVIESNQQIDLD